MRVIINADDLGMNAVVNSATFDLMARGRITSATLLANGAAVEEAAARTREFPNCSFGIHLNLTQYRPLTTEAGLAPLLDQAGRFVGKAVRSVKLTPALREAILEEWSAQVRRLLDLGVTVSHLDSHHHVHTVPGLFRVVKRLQKRFGIRKARLSMNIYPPSIPVTRKLLAMKWAWNLALRRWHRTQTTDAFSGFAGFCEAAAVRELNCQSVELMAHPGGELFDSETRLLDDASWQERLGFPLSLISYHEL